MAHTQLSTLVLPAPFGPMRAKSSPASTANDTPSSTLSPPKPRCTSRKSSSAIPPPRATVLLDLAVTAPGARAAEIELRHVGVRAQSLGGAGEDDAAALHHVPVIGRPQRPARVL